MSDKKQDERELEDEGGADASEAALAEEVVAGEEGGEESEVEVLQKELALLETQLQDMRARYIRAVADLDNARKRAREAIADGRRQAVSGVLLELLTLVDNFERAMEMAKPGSGRSAKARAIYEGVELIYRQLMVVLERRGVRPIEALGQVFDPSRHEAVAQMAATAEQREGTVAVEMQRGYLYGEQVLRHSRVGVAVEETDKVQE